MSDVAPDSVSAPVSAPAPRAAGAWPAALATGFVLVALIDWLLARVVFLPFYFGVFFFLIAGLLVGAIVFRVARPARPMSAGRIAGGVALVAVAGFVAGVWCEYRYIAHTIGDSPHFADARAAAQQAGRPVTVVDAAARSAFRGFLRDQFPPGGAIGYGRWAIASGHARLTVDGGFAAEVSVPHRRVAWVVRTLAAYGLLAAGLWSQLESLRSATPTSNFLKPGEEWVESEKTQ